MYKENPGENCCSMSRYIELIPLLSSKKIRSLKKYVFKAYWMPKNVGKVDQIIFSIYLESTLYKHTNPNYFIAKT